MPPKNAAMDAEFSKIIASSPIEGNDDIIGPHLPALADALRVQLDNDIAIFALAWKFNCKQPLKITREEWNNGWAALRITSIAAAANTMGGLRAETVPEDSFRQFYDFVFEWSRDNSSQRHIAPETAYAMWPVLFKDRSFPHLQQFIQYCQKKNTKMIPRDVWKQMYHFAKADLQNWDEMAAWPSLMDDFAIARKENKL